MKISESQLRKIISESINKIMIQEGIFGIKTRKEKDAEESQRRLARAEYERKNAEEAKRKSLIKQEYDRIISQLEDGIYVTIMYWHSYASNISAIYIQTKEDAAKTICNAKHYQHKAAQLKGPFNSYDEANIWISEHNLDQFHYSEKDSELFNGFNSNSPLMFSDNYFNRTSETPQKPDISHTDGHLEEQKK